jgi:hypothetical protein
VDGAAEAVADRERSRGDRLVVALARDLRRARGDREQRRAGLDVGGGAGGRLGQRTRVTLGEALPRGAEGEDLLALHDRKPARRSRSRECIASPRRSIIA